MNTKYAIVIAIITTLIISSIQVINFQENLYPSDELLSDSTIISDGPVSMEPLDLNVMYNPSFEEADTDGIPDRYTVSGTSYEFANMTYQDEVATGSYSCLLETQGTIMGAGNAYLRNSAYFSPQPTISEGLHLNFKWNTLANPELQRSDRVYLSVFTTNSTGYTQSLTYYLSHSTMVRTNSSTAAHFFMNQSLNQWNDFDRNITEDYDSVSELGNYDNSRYIYYTTLYTYQIDAADEKLSVVFDDFVLTNGTYSNYYENGDFESGTGNGWYSYNESPGYITQSSDSTLDSYSAELYIPTLNSATTAHCEMSYQIASSPRGYYSTGPGTLTLEFDWFYKDTASTISQYSYLRTEFRYITTIYEVYTYLGHGNDNPSMTNSSSEKYLNITDFGTRDSWNRVVIDLYDYMMMFGSTNMTVFEFEFRIETDEIGSSVTTRIDNIQVLTDPAGDPGFEIDWYSTVDSPFTGWYDWDGETGVISSSSDSHSGLSACNLTVEDDDGAGVRRVTSVEVDSSLFTDFWWRLDNITETGAGWAYLEISFNNSRFLTYRLGHSSQYTLPTNSSANKQILVDNFNETGLWHNLVRNMTYDLTSSFGSSNYVMTRIIINTYAGLGGRTSLIADDINFKDGSPPEFSSVTVETTPIISSLPVEVRAVVDDVHPGISAVVFRYSIGVGWISVPGVYNAGGWYEAVFPAQSFGTEVEFFVLAADGSDTIAVDNNGGLFYSYTVTDITGPTVSINAPLNDTSVEGIIPINVTATDTESDIAFVEIWIDTTLIANLTSAPFDHPWNTSLETAGLHTLEVVAYNNAGLSSNDSVVVLVLDQTTTTTTTTTTTNTTTTTSTTTTTTTSTTTTTTGAGDAIHPLVFVAPALAVIFLLVVCIRDRQKKK